ncbi:MAG: NepR family anti-sigma factor [Paracoccaceae bacterium]|nr:NepR family anti-sigma factor [Paracoccaceae bacterium]
MLQGMPKDDFAPKLREQIDQNLKRVYEDALKEDVPDRFRQLLEELRQKEAAKPPTDPARTGPQTDGPDQ